LSGVRVIELSRLLPGAYATLLMGDLGADVVKVEERGRGDYMRWVGPMTNDDTSAIFSASCRNKRSITVDLKTDGGREIVRDLASAAQVVVEGFRPGVAARLGLGYEDLREVNPTIVYCSISGYGQSGPMADRPGHDLNYLAASGVLDLSGEPDGAPSMPGPQYADVWGGGLTAAYAVLAALVGGKGGYLDVGMYDGSAAVLTNHAAAWLTGGLRFDRGRMLLSGGVPNYGVWPASDGWVTLACTEEKFWQRACELLEAPDLVSAFGATGDSAEAAAQRLRDIFSTRTRAEWDELLGGPETCFAPVLTLEEALEDQHMQARGLVADVGTKGESERQLLTAVDRLGAGRHEHAPRIGEHTDEILGELGRSAQEIDALRRSECV
jgi:crotonobetainyl-CoA:carnitine CoA-transferase CaiB-like acyl-CoA transferase